MYEIDIVDLGNKIREYRKAQNVSIEELGNIIGKSKTTVARYETGEIVIDIITAMEICNALNIDLNDICMKEMQGIEKDININPFNSNLLYLYYISKNGLIISSIEIKEKEHINSVLMKNGLSKGKYKQEYTGVLESNYNTAFICLTNAISNPGLDKFQIEIDLHSKENNLYYGIFLGISDNTHRPTARKCILTKELVKSKERLTEIFDKLKVSEEEAKDIVKTKYWDMKTTRLKEFVVKI